MTARTSLTRLGFSLAVMFASFGLAAASAHADTTSTMRAARLTYIQGSVTIVRADNPAGVAGQINMPLLTGVQVLTGDDGQAEVEFEDGSVVRLTPNTALALVNLAVQPDGVFLTTLSLVHGLAYCELRATPQYLYSLNAGGDILSPVENTTVRVNFDQPPAIFSVFDGTAQIERQSAPGGEAPSEGYVTQVRAGESVNADLTNGSRYFLTPQIASDTWDQWNDDLDQAAAAQSADSTSVRNNYAGAQGYGWSDLDANGNWYDVPGQGQVWQPQAAVDDSGFDPYGNGAWVWYPGTGYTWASGYAWGWTPYRCGNWSYYGGFGWGWLPGAGCGGLGWGFLGGGRPVNIVLGPTGYRPIHVPTVIGRPVRPVLPVGVTTAVSRPIARPGGQPGPRQIGGVTATPIRPVRVGPIPGTSTAGSTLRRDFPVDTTSHAPVLGLASTSPTVVHTNSGFRPASQPAPATGQRGTTTHPAYGVPASPAIQPARPAEGVRAQPYSQPTGRPAQPAQSAPRSMPAPSRPSYSPPPASHSAPAPHVSAPPPAPSHPK
jgi:hypothetical protein